MAFLDPSLSMSEGTALGNPVDPAIDIRAPDPFARMSIPSIAAGRGSGGAVSSSSFPASAGGKPQAGSDFYRKLQPNDLKPSFITEKER